MDERRYDVVILGGAFSGASAALLLRRERPELKVLVVEKQPAFDAKVGEATTEMSAMFMTRRLALWRHLESEHLPKEGLRYWFSNEKVKSHAEASETGAYQRSNVPSFQLRRDVLDEHILATAVAEGAELLRPARAVDVLVGRFDHRVTVDHHGRSGGREEISCRWLLDATGRATVLGKRLGLIERNEAHPTTAVWCRFKGVRHIDDLVVHEHDGVARGNVCSRRLGTNHYTGYGYWIWVIPLGNGETSVGLVFDRRMVDLDVSGSGRWAAFEGFLQGIPALAELLEGAEARREDLRSYSHLAFATRQYMGEGWALMGDAAAFLDPYYSPGLDHASFSVDATVKIVLAETAGEDVAARTAEHNAAFVRSYHRFFAAVFRDKYAYMGEGDLVSAATLLDTAHYYIFLVIPAYRILKQFYWMPVLGPRQAALSYRLMCLYNRRFVAIATARRAAGEEGRRNDGRRIVLRFDLNVAPFRMGFVGTKIWLAAELDLLRLKLKALFGRRRAEAPEALPATAASGGGPSASA